MKLFIANWKMQLSPTAALQAARSFNRIFKSYPGKAVICPDFLSLNSVAKALQSSPLLLGAQDTGAFARGAYTGEVSALDLAFLGVKYVLIGHSERRSYLQESDQLLSEKIKQAIEQKIAPVLCVGENAADRKQGRASVVIKEQLKGALLPLSKINLRSLVVAYEPVWAIGTGLNCEPAEALKIKNIITDWCQKVDLKSVPVLYGGSVKPENAASFLGKSAFDGLLIGGASLSADSFRKIVNY